MTSTTDSRSQPLVALHASASSGHQWQALSARLEGTTQVIAPDLWGYGAAPAWPCERVFTLAAEAKCLLERLQADAVHEFDLLGHSFGGAVALHLARRFPERVRALVLVEPVAFSMLRLPGAPSGSREAATEVRSLASEVSAAVARGELSGGMARFVDYWNGAGTWSGISSARQEALAARLPKVVHDFSAAFAEPLKPDSLARIRCPVLLIRGSLSPKPVHIIMQMLSRALPNAELVTVGGAGHMLPLTHSALCNELIAWHLERGDAARCERAA